MIAALAVLLALTTAPSREARFEVRVHRADPNATIVYSGGVRTRAHDRVVVYLARACEPTVARARKHVVAAYESNAPGRRWSFNGMLARSIIRPRRGRVCLLVAAPDGRRRIQRSHAYRLR